MFKDYPDVVSAREVAEMVGIGLKKAYRLLRTGEIRAFRCGNTFKAAKIEVIEYIFVRQCAQQKGDDPDKKWLVGRNADGTFKSAWISRFSALY